MFFIGKVWIQNLDGELCLVAAYRSLLIGVKYKLVFPDGLTHIIDEHHYNKVFIINISS